MCIDQNLYPLPTIHYVGGSTQELLFRTYFYRDKMPFDLSSCVANFSIIDHTNKHGAPLISKEMEVQSGDTIDGELVPNDLYVALAPEDTVDLEGKFIYQITIKDIKNICKVEIPKHGIMYITNNINKQYIRST